MVRMKHKYSQKDTKRKIVRIKQKYSQKDTKKEDSQNETEAQLERHKKGRQLE